MTDGFTVRFWGTRGAIPTPGRHTEKFGGNTTCVELRHGDTLVVIDAGSGIRALGNAWSDEFSDTSIRAHLLFTHLHWDHIQGFPFFTPGYREGNVFTIHGEDKPGSSVRDALRGQMQGAYFPVPMAAMQAELHFAPTSRDFRIDEIKVRTIALPHPGGCVGYRLETKDAVFVFATDAELDLAALNQDEISADCCAPRRYPAELLDFFRAAHMVVIDCQYTDAEYRAKRGWGHNSIATVVDLCAQARPDMALLFHHDPESSDEKVSAMVDETAARLKKASNTATQVLGARERMMLPVNQKSRALAVST